MNHMAWEKNNARYVCGENLRLGKWIIGGWHHEAPRKGEGEGEACYAVVCHLPGIRSHLGHRDSQEAAKTLLETAVKHWLAGLSAERSPDN